MNRKGAELVLLVEGIAAEMQEISNATVGKPFAQFKKDQLKVFVAKLKGWAISALHELRPDRSYHNPEKNYIGTLNKIINNPQETAEQIFSAVIAKQITTGNASISAKPTSMPVNDVKALAKIDDILDTIKF